MKPGSRALGIAESYTGESSTLAGIVQTAAGRLDGIVFGSCTVGGTDVTQSIIDLVHRLDREDIRVVLVAGVALAWYNIVDMDELAKAIDPPVIAVTFEESEGLSAAIDAAFEGDDRDDRLARYRSLPKRTAVEIAGQSMFIRTTSTGTGRASELVDAYTPVGNNRPEPLRVAKLAARAVDEVYS